MPITLKIYIIKKDSLSTVKFSTMFCYLYEII